MSARAKNIYPVGLRIEGVSMLDSAALREHAWHRSPVVLELDDGSTMYPSSDEEGNDAGAILVIGRDRSSLVLPPLRGPEGMTLSPILLPERKIARAGYQALPGWRGRPLVLVLDDGSTLVPQSDEEGNAAGTWLGTDRGQYFALPPR